jgi:UDP-N-acetylmuramate--alanine ligase
MSAIAQYLVYNGKYVSGSDRLFTSAIELEVRKQLEVEGIKCFEQNGSGITEETEVVVVSTAIEETNIEIAKAKAYGIPIVLRAELLAEICAAKKNDCDCWYFW